MTLSANYMTHRWENSQPRFASGIKLLGMANSEADVVPLFKAFARPHFEYCVRSWRPYLSRDGKVLEQVQRILHAGLDIRGI